MNTYYDIFLVLCRFRSHLNRHKQDLEPLCRFDRKTLSSIEVFYNATIDTALLVMRFSQAHQTTLDPKTVHQYICKCGAPVEVPSKLSADERRRFLMDHIRRYHVYLQQYCNSHDRRPLIVRALDTLASHIDNLSDQSRPTRISHHVR